MTALTIGALVLDPTFSSAITEYSAVTTNATNTISATATDSANAVIEIKVNGTTITNGSAATWISGENTVAITVTNGDSETVYTVTVTKS